MDIAVISLLKSMQTSNYDRQEEFLKIEMFGRLRAVVAGQSIHNFGTSQASILLVYLAIHRGQNCSRDLVAELLWPDKEPLARRTRLRDELAVLRSLLGRDAIVRVGNTALQMNEKVQTDVHFFDTATLSAVQARDVATRLPHLRSAFYLYADGFLPGMSAPDISEEKNWLEEERNRVQEVHLDITTRLILDLVSLDCMEEANVIRMRATALHPKQYLPQSTSHAALRTHVVEAKGTRKTDFVGRSSEKDWVQSWAGGAGRGILNIIGIGGIGKTRLVQEALIGIPHITISMENIKSAEELFGAIHSSLRLPITTPRPIPRQVWEELRMRNAFVLVLDGAERSSNPVRNFILLAQAQCSQLRVLLTARHALRIPEETILALKALPTNEALSLFLNRARNIRPEFAPTQATLRQAQEVVDLLEGMPLALELAAARALVLGPGQMKQQLSQRLPFLASVNPIHKRQRLRLVLEWSFDILSQIGQRLLGYLSVFRGTFSFAAADAVCCSPRLLDTLEELRLYGLIEVNFDTEQDEGEYHLISLISEFAEEKTDLSTRRQAQKRHIAFYLQEARGIADLIKKRQWQKAVPILLQHLPNLRATVQYSHSNRDNESLLILLIRLGLPYMELGFWNEFEELIRSSETLLKKVKDVAALSQIRGWQAALARRRGDGISAWSYWHMRHALLREVDDTGGIINTLYEMVGQSVDEGDPIRARQYLTEAELLASQFAEPWAKINGCVLTARLAVLKGDNAEAIRSSATAISLVSASSTDLQNRMYTYTYVGSVLLDIGQVDIAEVLIKEGLVLCYEQNRWFGFGVLLSHSAQLHERRGDLNKAALAASFACAIHEELESRYRESSQKYWLKLKANSAGTPDLYAIAEGQTNWRTMLPDFLSNLLEKAQLSVEIANLPNVFPTFEG